MPSKELPALDLTPSTLRRLYHDVPHHASVKLQRAAVSKQRSVRIGAGIVLVWLVGVPVAIALIEFNSPEWLAWVALFYSLSQAYIAALRLLGMWPKTPSEAAADDEQRRMRHHHYHCERNPEGFRHLVAETLRRESRDHIQREVEELRRQPSNRAG
ncbi:MAG: hypothetical protein ABR606_18200 [Vicinamibacterales bacterium]